MNNDIVTIIPILMKHMQKYPLMQAQDIYKLMHQAAMGPAHLIVNKSDAYHKFLAEFYKIDKNPSESLFEEIDPEDRIIRINLRPYKECINDPERLFDFFHKTSMLFVPQPKRISRFLDEIDRFSLKNSLIIDKDNLKKFIKSKSEKEFPLVSHSTVYRQAYQPAYRLILKEYAGVIK